ncbi:MAG: SET domain-containing protein-lysine N-methyltransferase [Chitinophagaceae bacterium]
MKPPDHKRIAPEDLYIKKSNLPGTGKGLFTRKPISKGEIILEYKGLITTFKKIEDNPVFNPYVYFVNRNHVIDAMHFPESLGRYANDAEGMSTMPGYKNNAAFIVVKKRVYLEAKTDIVPGSEIFVAYGKDYWDAIRFNLAVDESYKLTRAKKKK